MEESLLTFPCEFPIKVMGKKSDEFEIAVLGIIRKHFKDIPSNALQVRDSAKGHYLAITVTVTAQSQEQLDAMYQELSAHELVLMAF